MTITRDRTMKTLSVLLLTLLLTPVLHRLLHRFHVTGK